jgi:hypothetical protein
MKGGLPEVVLHVLILLWTGEGLAEGVLGVQGGARHQHRVQTASVKRHLSLQLLKKPSPGRRATSAPCPDSFCKKTFESRQLRKPKRVQGDAQPQHRVQTASEKGI